MVGVLTLLPSLLLLPPLSSALPEIIKIGQTKKKIIKNQAVSVLIICGLGSRTPESVVYCGATVFESQHIFAGPGVQMQHGASRQLRVDICEVG